MLNVSVKLSRLMLLNLNKSDISNGRSVVMADDDVIQGIIDCLLIAKVLGTVLKEDNG